MAVQILNDMPDAAVHRGDLADFSVRTLQVSRRSLRISGRAVFMAATIGVHLIVGVAFMSIRQERVQIEPEPIVATLMESSTAEAEPPREFTPPPVNVVYSLTVPQELAFESEAPPEVITAAISDAPSQAVAPPMIETVEYVRPPAPKYPTESQRHRERGTVLLRVMVDVLGRPAQIQIERSSGFTRLDDAARMAVEKALFHPHVVNGIAQPAQVLIPIEFARRSG
ncbi:MAG TPA: TonB family protein [Steroidobacteraceae bacterium]|nr:TonB family protein [Steroidobacteraceae bacterium]